MRGGRRARRLAIVTVAVLVAVACNSTTKEDGAQRGPDQDKRGAVLPAPPKSAAATPEAGKTIAGSSVDPSTTVTTATDAPSERAAIKIGVLTWEPVGEVDYFGLRFKAPDPRPMVDALVAELNATGGIAGRRVTAVIAAGSNPTSVSREQFVRSENEACIRLTEDEKVFLVLSVDGASGLYAQRCYANHHTPYLDLGGAGDQDYRDMKPWLLPAPVPSLDALARAYVQGLREQGFIGPKMGVWVWDIPGFRRVADRVLVPELTAAGGEVVDVFYSAALTVGDYFAELSSAVLRFQSRGVERVILWDIGTAWPDFAQRADAQAWKPRYGLYSGVHPHNNLPDVPRGQRVGTVAAGTCPACDVGDSVFPLTTREKACFDIVNRRAGTSFSKRSFRDNENNFLPMATLSLCQLLDMTRAALAPATGKALAQSDLWKYFHALGDQPPVVTPPQTRFTPEEWDGAEYYAHLAYHENCDCFRYTSDWKRIPRE